MPRGHDFHKSPGTSKFHLKVNIKVYVNLQINVDVSKFVIPDFIEWFRVLQILDQIGDSVVVGEFVQNVGHVERCGLNN